MFLLESAIFDTVMDTRTCKWIPFEALMGSLVTRLYGKRYCDYGLRTHLKARGWTVLEIELEEWYREFKNLGEAYRYLLARAFVMDRGGETWYSEVKSRYEGTVDERDFLLDSDVDDLVVRTSDGFGLTFVAAVVDGKDVVLHGRRIDWDILYRDDAEVERYWNREERGFVLTDDVMEAWTMDAYEGDAEAYLNR